MHPSVVRAAIGGLIVCALASPTGAQTPNVKLMLDFSIQGQQSPFVLAAEGGYFARAGVTVEVDRGYGSADAITKVASRAYDMAFADIGALIQFRGKQIGAQVISVFQVYEVAPMLILSLKRSNITKPSDLAGKQLASPPGASSRVMFPLFAAATGLDPSSVSWIDVTPQLRETLLAQGRTDAITTLVTDLAGLDRLGITENDVAIMRFSDFGVALYGHCILTTAEFAAKNPETVKKLLRATAKGYRDAMANPKAAAQAMAKYMKIPEDPDVLEKQVEATVVSTNAPAGKPLGWQEAADWQNNLSLLKETGGVAEVKPVNAYYSNEYLQ